MRKISTRMWVQDDSMQMMGIRLPLRMTLVKLADDSMWMHTPTPHNPQIRNRVAAMGELKHIVAPSNGHNLFLEDWQRSFPDAGIYVADGVPKKRPNLKNYTLLRDLDTPPWEDDLQMLTMAGAPLWDEHMFYYARGKTLLVTDFFQNYTGVKQKGMGKIITKLLLEPLGFKGKCLAPPLKTRFAVKDKNALRASLDKLWDLDIECVVPAHGDIFEQDAKQIIRQLCQRFYD
ncbi:MAG: DUF4336 domain-containing protein [Gammaproteobacteria bacterium]|jgi:hypothetical protein|nr:DUF4336 domain-containing protein [Gammaproteobacteria bacterium]MDX2460344.1 DUF4336 domain-containing protein [Gammaproteobacteria bacterium]